MSSSPVTSPNVTFLDNPIDIILEIAHHLELLERQEGDGVQSSIMSLASCNTSLYILLSPLVFRKLVFEDNWYDSVSGKELFNLREMCTMLANTPSYNPPWLLHVKDVQFLDWSNTNVIDSVTDIYARALGRLKGLETISFCHCFEVDERFFDVMGKQIFPRHIAIDNSPFRAESLRMAWLRITDATENQNLDENGRELRIHMFSQASPHGDTPEQLLTALDSTPQMAQRLFSLSLSNSLHIDEIPLLFKVLPQAHHLEQLFITGITCNSLRSVYDDPEKDLRELRGLALPRTSLPNLTVLQIPPGFLPFFTLLLTRGSPRHILRKLDLSSYYGHDNLRSLCYIPVTNIPFDYLRGKDGESVPLPGVEELNIRIDQYLQWNLGEWFPNLKRLGVVDVSMASTSSFLTLLASHWPSFSPSSTSSYSLQSLTVTSMPRDPRSMQFLGFLDYRYSELDLKWQVEGVKALSKGPSCLQSLREFSCGEPVVWRREPQTTREGGGPLPDASANAQSSSPGAECGITAPGDSGSPSTPGESQASEWMPWKPHVNLDCVENIKDELQAMFDYGVTDLYSDYEGCLRALFSDEDRDGERRALVQALEEEN
ncbi:hypothetical protein D9758_013060 [Tetrapyrgos nigripes]|uniref:Uncharacterized protein n=1 Tax=Tetrapyrgos nigripes TaxID=182062 RepID=A0A8H5CQQ6_9AGAR|nr:hypothetical protein D9758_013060 [Tetrapyrgos nigripes]